MKAHRYFSLLFIVIAGIGSAQNIVFPVIRELKGNVRSVHEECFTARLVEGRLERGKMLKKANYLFDTKNKLVEKNDYDTSGALLERYVANYNDNENPVEETQFNADKILNKYSYRYDDRQNRIGWMTHTLVDTAIARAFYMYDDKNRVVADSFYDGKGRLANWSAYTFDKEGHLTQEINCNTHGEKITDVYDYDMDGNKIQDLKMGGDGSTKCMMRYLYNHDGLLSDIDMLTDSASDYLPVEKIKYNADGKKTEDIKYSGGQMQYRRQITYDTAGNITSDAYYKADGRGIEKYLFTYNPYKNKTEEEIFMADTLFEKHTYRYDNHQNKTEEDLYSTGNISKFVVEYDKENNPVKEVNYINNEPTTITEREITYY